MLPAFEHRKYPPEVFERGRQGRGRGGGGLRSGGRSGRRRHVVLNFDKNTSIRQVSIMTGVENMVGVSEEMGNYQNKENGRDWGWGIGC